MNDTWFIILNEVGKSGQTLYTYLPPKYHQDWAIICLNTGIIKP